MAGPYGNPSAPFVSDCQFVTFDATSDPSAALEPTTQQITLYATSACWVKVGIPGGTPVAAIPGAEKVKNGSIFIPASVYFDLAVPRGTDEKPVKIAAIDDGTGGNVYIFERTDE